MWILESYQDLSVAGIGLVVCFMALASLYITIKLYGVVDDYVEKNNQKLQEIVEILKRLK